MIFKHIKFLSRGRIRSELALDPEQHYFNLYLSATLFIVTFEVTWLALTPAPQQQHCIHDKRDTKTIKLLKLPVKEDSQ